jgi:putative chitinase
MPIDTQIRSLYPRATEEHLASFIATSGKLFEESGISQSKTRLYFFLAQIGHESGGLTVLEENLNYRAERLMAVWPKRFPNLTAAQPYAGNPQALASFVYANRMGNGSPESGDGWNFRGRGYIQITGRDAYAAIGDIAQLDLTRDPGLATAPAHALAVACAFWRWKGLNALCDADDFELVTRKINGGTNGMADRQAWLGKVHQVFGE